jgi:Ni/Co efflux regulator RcnB
MRNGCGVIVAEPKIRRLNMHSIKVKSRLSGIFLTLSLLLGVGVFSAVGAQAQDVWRQNRQDRDWNRDRANRRDRDWDNDRDSRRGNGRFGRGRYGRYGQRGQAGYGNYGSNDIYRVAQQQGYRDGLYTGSSDAQRGQSYDPQRSHFYREANSGYNSSYGNRGQYQQAYRQGFLQGYRQGFQQYGGYNRNGNNSRRWPW